VLRFVAMLALFGCSDVPIGRQLPDGPHAFEVVVPTTDVVVRALEVGPGGEVYLLGELGSSVDLGDGPVTSVSEDSRDGFLLALDADGGFRWKVLFRARFMAALRLVLRDELLVSGYFRGTFDDGATADTSPTSQSAFFASYDTDGARTSFTSITSASGFGNVQAKGVDADGARLLRCGHYLDVIDLGGPLPGADVAGDNGFVATASFAQALTTPESSGTQGAYVQDCALTPSGLRAGAIFDLEVTHPGGTEVADGIDALALAFADDGTLRWARTLTGAGTQHLNHVETRGAAMLLGGTSDGAFEFAGTTVDGGAYVGMLDEDGDVSWARPLGEVGSGVLSLDADALLVAGYLRGPLLDLRGGEDADGFVLALDERGEPRWARRFASAGRDDCHAHGIGGDVVVACTFDEALTSPTGRRLPASLWITRFTP